MKLRDITEVLRSRLAAMPNRPQTVWQNQIFDPASIGVPFLVVSDATITQTRLTLDRSHIITGSMQIAVVVREGQSDGEAMRIADDICGHFEAVPMLGFVEIPSRPFTAGGYSDPPYWRVPVIVRWRVIDQQP